MIAPARATGIFLADHDWREYQPAGPPLNLAAELCPDQQIPVPAV